MCRGWLVETALVTMLRIHGNRKAFALLAGCADRSLIIMFPLPSFVLGFLTPGC